MSDFRQLTDTFWASPQIDTGDIAEAKALGVTMIVNNRPEGEAPEQTPGAAIEAAARAAGIEYRAIPVTHAGFSEEQVRAMTAAIRDASGPVLAYCRSGTRSSLLWALAQAARGEEPGRIADAAAGAGYDVAPIRAMMDMLAARRAG